MRQLPSTGESLYLREQTAQETAQSRAHVIETIDGGRLGLVRAASYPKWNWAGEGPEINFIGQLLLPLQTMEAALRRDTAVASGVGMLWVALAQGVVARSLRRRSRILSRIAGTAEELSRAGAPAQRLPVEAGEPELSQFCKACNVMLDRLEDSYASRQQFIADAAHELRTPLAILLGEVEVALRRERDPAKYQSVLESNREEIVRLIRLTENLLLLARTDGAAGTEEREWADPAEAARTVAAAMSSLPGRVPVQVTMSGSPGRIHTAPGALHHLLTNLVDNAQRYSPPEASVLITLSQEQDTVVITVSDQGPGIAPHHLPHLFERFYRVDPARHRASGGAGLGLAIVHALTTASGGAVSARSVLGEGSTFTITLPSAANQHGDGGDV